MPGLRHDLPRAQEYGIEPQLLAIGVADGRRRPHAHAPRAAVSVGRARVVPDGLDRAWLRRHTHMDRIGLARSGELVVAGCAGGGWCACGA